MFKGHFTGITSGFNRGFINEIFLRYKRGFKRHFEATNVDF